MEFKTKIIEIINETLDVKTFRLEKPLNFDFISGQFCIVGLIDDKNDDKKPFTFSSSPKSDYLDLTIKKMGNFTSKIFELKKGDELIIDGPNGESLNFDKNIKNVVYIAGGSGITPFISHIRYIIDKNLENNVYLFFANKTKNDIIYYNELKNISLKNKNIHTIFTLSDETQNILDNKIEKGRINSELIIKYLKNPKEYTYYLCGPPPMVESLSKQLSSIGVNNDKIIFESWQIPGKSG